MHEAACMTFPVQCSCGRSYSRDSWKTLRFDGIQTGYDEEKHIQVFEDMELRRCLCGSTMAVPKKLLGS
jgi:hypothetical protein